MYLNEATIIIVDFVGSQDASTIKSTRLIIADYEDAMILHKKYFRRHRPNQPSLLSIPG